jgi:hypothetical protein
MSIMPLREPRWLCQECQHPIAGADGFVQIVDRRSVEKPGYDPDAADDSTALNDDGSIDFEATTRNQVRAAVEYIEDPMVEFYVVHQQCAKPAEGSAGRPYVIECHRAQRIEHWMAWVEHLAEKHWMKRRDIVSMMRFWFDAHGISVPHDLP